MLILNLVRNFVPSHDIAEAGGWHIADCVAKAYDVEGGAAVGIPCPKSCRSRSKLIVDDPKQVSALVNSLTGSMRSAFWFFELLQPFPQSLYSCSVRCPEASST